MYPVFKRGDLIIVENAGWEFKDINVGDIVVYKAHWPNINFNIYALIKKNPEDTLFLFNVSKKNSIVIKYLGKADNFYIYEIDGYFNTLPVVHRVIKKIDFRGETYYITKGDNNPIHDPELIRKDQIVQKVVTINGKPLVIPYLGYLSIYAKEYWYLIILGIVLYYGYRYLKEG